jgi:3D (Asp-Asp-Asp) domain-containing protein
MSNFIVGLMLMASVQITPLGEYEVTAYAGDGITATGTVPRPYQTVAVDPQVIPYGTQLYLEGVGIVTAEDCGGAIKGEIIDLYLPSEGECVQWGRQERKVWRVK